MKVPLHIVQARREQMARLLAEHGYLPVGELCRRLEVSEATARRDLIALAEEKKIKRTYGGAMLEFDPRFPSFTERRDTARAAKAAIARAALREIHPHTTLYFDTGTTLHAIAQAFREHPVTPITIVTGNIPVGELLAEIDGVELCLLAGQLIPRQSVLVGDAAIRSLGFWRFDAAFLSAEAMNAQGLWNTQERLVAQQQAAIACSAHGARTLFCLDATKLGHATDHFLLPWERVDTLLTDASPAQLRKAGIPSSIYKPLSHLQ